MGIITSLSISVVLTLFFFKYKKNKQTYSDSVLTNNIPPEELSNTAYEDIDDVDNMIPIYGNEGVIRTNQNLRRNQVVYQNVLVCNDHPNASDQSLETQSSNYERLALSQIEKRDGSYQPLQQVNAHAEGGTFGNIHDFSRARGSLKYENIFVTKNYENVDSKEKIKDVNLASLSNNGGKTLEVYDDKSANSIDVENLSIQSIRSDKSRKDHDYVNTTFSWIHVNIN